MAQVKKRTTASGEARYDVRVRTPSGEVRTRTFRTLREAQKHASTSEAVLGGPLISGREAIVAAAESLIRFGLVARRDQDRGEATPGEGRAHSA